MMYPQRAVHEVSGDPIADVVSGIRIIAINGVNAAVNASVTVAAVVIASVTATAYFVRGSLYLLATLFLLEEV